MNQPKIYKTENGDKMVVASGGVLELASGCTFTLGGAEVSLATAGLVADEVAYLVGITAGTVIASKAIVVDANKDAAGIRNLGATKLTAGTNGASGAAGEIVVNNGANPGAGITLTYADVALVDGLTAGTVVASKAVTVDANKDASGVRYLGVTKLTAGVNGEGGAAGEIVVNDGQNPGAGITLAYADVALIDGLTAGTVAASKAVTVDANKDVGDFRNVKLLGLDFEAGATDITMRIVDGKLIVSNLPTADPTTAGALWADSGVLKLSAGT